MVQRVTLYHALRITSSNAFFIYFPTPKKKILPKPNGFEPQRKKNPKKCHKN